MSEAPAAPAVEAPVVAPVVPEVPTGTAPEVAQPEKTFTQKELDEILEKRLGKERRKRDDDKREKEYWRQEALKRTQQPEPAKAAPTQVDQPPRREDHPNLSYEEYLDLRAEWKAERAADKRFAKQKEEDEQNRTATERKKQAETFNKRLKELSKDLPDFDEVMADLRSNPDHPAARLYAPPIDDSENPAAILYHLAKNPDEAERIASLPESKQAREIVLLEMKLKAAPPAKNPSKAPAPISPVGGKTGPSGDLPDDSDSTAAWIEKENKRVRKSKA